MASVIWKSAEILKVFGTTIREGVYTGNKADPNGGQITPDLPTEFTPAKIAKIYENISTHVPLYIGHSTDVIRKPIGYAYKFGVTENLDDIKYNGFVFDNDAIVKIATMGYDKVSPEISEDDSELRGIAFVLNPAITGTDADMELKVFNAAQTDSNTGATPMADETTTMSAPITPAQTPAQTQSTPVPAQTPVQPVGEKNTVDVSALVAQADEFRTKYEQANARIEAMMTQQYEGVVSEMKSLGVSDPGSIVRGLPTEQKIAVLNKMKESIVLNKPLATPSTSESPVGKSTVDTAVAEVLQELGVSSEEYAKITKRR